MCLKVELKVFRSFQKKRLFDLEGIMEEDASVILHQIDEQGKLINVLVGKLKPIDENTVFFEGKMGKMAEEKEFEFELKGKFID